MANSILIDVVKSVTKTSFTSVFTAIAIIRLGMMVYPPHTTAHAGQTAYQVDESAVEVVEKPADPSDVKTIAKDQPRIVFGKNSIESLKNRN